MPVRLFHSAVLLVACSILVFPPLAGSPPELRLPQRRWNLLHTPHFHNWELSGIVKINLEYKIPITVFYDHTWSVRTVHA